MNKAILFLIVLGIFATSSCHTGTDADERKYEAMTRYGAWQARADETRAKVGTIETEQSAYLRYEFDSLDRSILDSPYPYWDKIQVFLDKKGIRKAKLYANPAKSFLTEEFYFENGNLIYAQIDSQGIRELEPDSIFRGDRYFFTKNVLVLALDSKGKRKDITDDSVKIKSVDLINESDQIKQIIADKQIKL
ncbi:MAG TPA: hypothetical protein DCG19_13280 [Cryomorphaceae bacterium]|nr:hypothetical protein [Owenweeksia sp.]MBG00129.1 hypothetical protein [Owenweeksia sp.]HAD98376.1 hypothetical protein [Cryomorphaceae bacterium]HBF20301.1 hypothetical protein [Cryomorphaceae bacterium]HCQ17052.1 hypothetical protein [Cryomorphaceae bacterium]|tara:strand:+ start:527 stop:1102 length:576 start_codon:yes stop_codon:yes gene_type:complete